MIKYFKALGEALLKYPKIKNNFLVNLCLMDFEIEVYIII